VNIYTIIVFLYSYFIGSIPFGLIVTRVYLKKDIRNIGSGNIGATNVLRTGKKYLALLTLLLDVFKGYLAIYITAKYFNDFIYLSALVCLLGHIFPLWMKFKGGKGVAVYLGIILALSIKITIIFGISWLIILYVFKYSSLSSIFSTLIIFLYSLTLNDFDLSVYFFVVFVIVLYSHKENILRLKNKKENKIKF
jgi:glycerol-3-phosphate acyltransferase PlsY|tara:strand:- start:84 stop:665 length:582 start_codon:yes stop_codon:yes gene_type:complete